MRLRRIIAALLLTAAYGGTWLAVSPVDQPLARAAHAFLGILFLGPYGLSLWWIAGTDQLRLRWLAVALAVPLIILAVLAVGWELLVQSPDAK